MDGLPRGTVTFLFTDIEGSTQLLHRLGRSRYGQLLEEHERILRSSIDTHDGRVVDTQGDAFFAVFGRAKDAVESAVDAQRTFHSSPWEGIELRVRMGMHTGEAQIELGRYVGIAVHRAQRICAAGHGGQILLSSTTSDVVGDDLPNRVRLRDLGSHRLKDLARPERLAQLVGDGLPENARKPRRAPARPWETRRVQIAAAVLVGVIGVSAYAFARSGDEAAALTRVDLNSVGVIDPKRNVVVSEVHVGTRPTQVAVGGDVAWVLNADDETVSRIDATKGTLDRSIPVGSDPVGIAATSRFLYVVTGRPQSVERVDLYNSPSYATRFPGTRLRTSSSGVTRANEFVVHRGVSIAAAGTDAWVAGVSEINGIATSPTISRLERHGRVVDSITDSELIDSAAVIPMTRGANAIWFARESAGARVATASGAARRIDTSTNTLALSVDVGGIPEAIAVGEGAVWVGTDNAVWRVDPNAGVVTARIPIAGRLSGIAAGEGGVWVANSGDATVSRINPKTNQVVATIKLGNRPDGIAVGAGKVWVTVY